AEKRAFPLSFLMVFITFPTPSRGMPEFSPAPPGRNRRSFPRPAHCTEPPWPAQEDPYDVVHLQTLHPAQLRLRIDRPGMHFFTAVIGALHQTARDEPGA